MTLCDQFCGTHVHFKDGRPYNDRDNKPHLCARAQIAREFEGYYNMIQIKDVRGGLRQIQDSLIVLNEVVSRLDQTLNWQEANNQPLAEAFIKRKEAGRKRNHQ